MKNLLYTIFFTGLGFFLATLLGLDNISESKIYSRTISILLAFGLYSSVYGIDISELKNNIVIVVLAVTVGVLLKILFIGILLYFITGSILFFLLGVIVAQIDPLSVAALDNQSRLSAKARTILRAWSSFDDPMTVIVAIYTASIIASYSGQNTMQTITNNSSSYIINIALNLILPLGVYIINRVTNLTERAKLLILAVVFLVGIYYFLMLGIALTGLILRPKLGRLIGLIVTLALYVAVTLLGILLVDGLETLYGILLAFTAVVAQIVVSFLLTARLSSMDRLHLAFAQQNGVTAITLALLFEAQFQNIVAIVAPAIFLINVIYLIANAVIDRSSNYLVVRNSSRPN